MTKGKKDDKKKNVYIILYEKKTNELCTVLFEGFL